MTRSKNWWTKFFHSWYTKVCLVGLVIRLTLAVTTIHPDVWSLDFARYHFADLKIWDFYEYQVTLPDDHPLVHNYGRNFFTYPPLAYFTLGLFGMIFKPFAGPERSGWIIENYPNFFHEPWVPLKLFWLKLPYVFFDLGIAFLLRDFFTKNLNKKRVWLLWWLNPVVWYAAYMMGQFELMPLFFAVLSLWLAKKKHFYWAAASLGFGGAYKLFPLFFLPILAARSSPKFSKQLAVFLFGLLAFAVIIFPFLGSSSFRSVVLFSSQSEKMLHMSLPVSASEGVYAFVFLWGLVFFASLNQSRKSPLWLGYLAVMVVYFSVTHYHPQWFVWLTPFLIIRLVADNFRQWRLAAVMVSAWFFIMLMFHPLLNYKMFLFFNEGLSQARPISDLVGRYYDVSQLKSICRSLFAAAGLVLVVTSGRRLSARKLKRA